MKDLSNKEVIHNKKKGIEYLQFRRLLEYPDIKHCYTMRENNLNFRIYENDDILQESYHKICNALEEDKKCIVKPHQTHTDRVEVVQDKQQKFSEIDGLITDEKDIFLCTTSADCTSILLYDPIRKVIGDIHSGWRGTVQRIGQKAIKKMIEVYGCNPEDIICCICPHIRKCHFEVDEDVMQMFQKEFAYTGQLDKIIGIGRKQGDIQKYNIDTSMINHFILEEVGIQKENIIDSGICTVCEVEHFHSHRADKDKAGRNAAMIMKK